MCFLIRGLAAALLFVSFFIQTGCSRKQELYLSGIEKEVMLTETEQESEYIPEITENTADTEDVSGVVSQEVEGYVFVCGSVCEPGVYPIQEGMRVYEAVALAGGFTDDADEEWLNQAEYVSDGQKLYVYSEEETFQMRADGESPDLQVKNEAQADHKININTADKETLMTLPGIGEAKADAIIQYREEYGFFPSIEEIQNIPGIKNAVFSKIKEMITV